jgi:hypothetical protein
MGLFEEMSSDIATPPVFIEVHSDYKGGGTLSNIGLVDKSLIRAGALVNFDENTRLVTILKTAVVVEVAAGGAVAYKIAKQNKNQAHLFVSGDIFAKTVGGPSYAGTLDTTTSPDYDIVTVGTTLGAMAVGDVLFHSAASGAAAGDLKVKVNGQLRNDHYVSKNEFVAVVRQGITYNRRLPFAAPQAVKDALKGFIIFSEQR